MKNKLPLILLLSFTGILILNAQKKPLDHSVYDSWESVTGISIPYNGKYAIYYETPQQGDKTMFLYNLQSGEKLEFPRGKSGVISQDGENLLYRISPLYLDAREAKVKKKKGADVPKDTLAIMSFRTGETTKYPYLKSVKYGQELEGFIAFQEDERLKARKEPKDTTKQKEEIKPEIDKTVGKPLFVVNLKTLEIDTIDFVDKYTLNRDASLVAYITKPGKEDSLTKRGLYLYSTLDGSIKTVLEGDKKAEIELPSFDENSLRLAFYAQLDTLKKEDKFRDIYLYDVKSEKSASVIVSNETNGIPEGWMVAEKASLSFSDDGSRIGFGTKPIPEEEDTTVAEFERVDLDVWVWDADYLPTVESVRKKKSGDATYTAAYYFADPSRVIQLADEDLPSVRIPKDFTQKYILSSTDKPYRVVKQWEDDPHADIYRINVETGERELLMEDLRAYSFSPSPDGDFYTWYDIFDQNWFIYDMAAGKTRNLTRGLDIFYNDEQDTPGAKRPFYGLMWFEDEDRFVINAKYDVWQFDATGVAPPFMLTEGLGKQNKTQFRITTRLFYLDNSESKDGFNSQSIIPAKKSLFFSSFNKVTKESGIYTRNITRKNSKMLKMIEGKYRYRLAGVATSYEYPGIISVSEGLNKSRNLKKRPRRDISIPIFVFTKGNFENSNNVYVTKDVFRTELQITSINPQQKDYNWGTVEMVHWMTKDSISAEGLLYKPEDFDSSKKYPVMIYFYDRDSDGLYSYKSPAPSRSTINIPYFVSNGYIVFVPNIYYKEGEPGQSAMRSIMPGVDMICENEWVDQDNMAIQGQSWGGYQVAYMITQTDRFKAAGAGAPVSNMTSAYGGIRTSSGVTRQFQYEQGQSRIGKNLWDGYDLYYKNSPLFFIPNVKTPVLIMHNDNDGAVPWAQGIEFFVGLRRLGKQAWMLQYKGEAHNLVERHNAKDLSRKLAEFFDHFLKGEPEPEWMKKQN